MVIGFITNSRAPYRLLQIKKILEIKDLAINVYYTNSNVDGRKWIIDKLPNLSEKKLKGIQFFKKRITTFDVNINIGLTKIIKENDVILLGGYEQPTYVAVSILCKLMKKKYILLFDGISPQKIFDGEKNRIRYLIKRFVINNAVCIFGNGQVSKLYFEKKYMVNANKIYNQYLTVDIDYIMSFANEKKKISSYIKDTYGIDKNANVLMYSGRLLDWKNVDVILEAMNILKDKDKYVLLIVGDGEERLNIEKKANKYHLNVIITGFIREQKYLFKHYYVGDLFIFPTSHEAWGLVVNEAMAAGMPIIASNQCGCSLDLIKEGENGYIFKYNDAIKLKELIEAIFQDDKKRKELSKRSLQIIKQWTFERSKCSFEQMLKILS